MTIDWKYGTVIENSGIPEKLSIVINIGAITLYPFIIFRNTVDERTLNHERIHIAQQKETLVLFFYILYGLFWIINIAKYRSGPVAYMNIPFEREAYDNDHDFSYLVNRKKFSWLKYLWKNQNSPK